MCGEQPLSTRTVRVFRGSPPRVRGTDLDARGGGSPGGITPACAGNSSLPTRPNNAIKDHPRVCGEQPIHTAQKPWYAGSPPRVRGTAIRGIRVPFSHGITPACAGNSGLWGGRQPAHQDHPRVCGEQIIGGTNAFGKMGSPPRVRGTAQVDSLTWFEEGITPACAGNRSHRKTRIDLKKDHPRVCGEQDSI